MPSQAVCRSSRSRVWARDQAPPAPALVPATRGRGRSRGRGGRAAIASSPAPSSEDDDLGAVGMGYADAADQELLEPLQRLQRQRQRR
eukprot:scaffold237328_cov44-Tisochrysis_lutea.AAC.1